MEAAVTSSAAVPRSGGSHLPISSNRKKWRAVTDYHRNDHSVRSSGDEDMQRSKIEQPDDRVYEQTRDQADVDFCTITADETIDTEILRQRAEAINNRRQELLMMEVELRAQVIARKKIMAVQNRFDSQLKEHSEFIMKLQEQLNDKEEILSDYERRLEEKNREIHAIKLDNEAAWAKEDLLREQNKELMTIRREREHSEAERLQHIQQIRDLQDRVQEKERQILEFQEQSRAAQETIFLKDEQLKAWISRVQEMDALQSSTNQSLQAQLRDRTDQYNQLWLGCQRQFAEMERLHLHTIQQIQLEISDTRERSGAYSDDARGPDPNLKDPASSVHGNGNPQEFDGKSLPTVNNGVIVHSNAENFPFGLMGASNQGEQIPPSSLIGVPAYLPHGQVAAIQPFVMHQQGLSHSHSSVGHLHSLPFSSIQQWQSQQQHLESSQIDQSHMRSDDKYEYGMSANGHNVTQMDSYVGGRGAEADSGAATPSDLMKSVDSVDRSYSASSSLNNGMQQMASQFAASLKLNALEQSNDKKEQKAPNPTIEESQEAQEKVAGVDSSIPSSCETPRHTVNHSESAINHCVPQAPSSQQFAKSSELPLLDERSLLACVVRTIPPGGRIRMASTLPNRLAKMLAPLHWSDYSKKYGKLDEFVASHPELFFIDGDMIQLREGAQAKVAATAAVAKVAAAAAAASAPYSSYLPSVAVTPIAQSHRMSRVVDHGNSVNATSSGTFSNPKLFNNPRVSHNGRTHGASNF